MPDASEPSGLDLLRSDVRWPDRLQLCRTALAHLRVRFGAVVCSLGIADFAADELCVLTDASVDHDQLPSFVGFPLDAHLLLTDSLGSSDVRVLAADDYSGRYPTVATVVRRPDVRSLVAVGFQRQGVTGAISLGLPTEPDDRLTSDLQATASVIGDALARHDDQTRRNRHAAELHRSLIPGDRSTSTVLRRSLMVPASPDDAVGGDWYDVFDLPDGRVAVVVGDVVGRGADAAIAMGQAAAALRALVVCTDEPHEAIEGLDRFAAVTPAVAGSSCAVAIVDPAEGRLRLCVAGHPPAIVLGGHGAPARPAGHGPLVGFPEGARRTEELAFGPGATMVLASDGVLRATAAGAADGAPDDVAGLVQLVDRLDARAPGMFVARIAEHWLAPGPPSDDVVVVALHRPDEQSPVFSCTRDATPQAITELRRALGTWLDRHGHDSIRSEVELAVSELLANVVEHAYRTATGPAAGRMIVEAVSDGDVLQVAVIDDGRWTSQIVDTVRGRGLSIVDRVADAVEVRSDGHGTVVRLRFGQG
ncbi:MAG: SpoIIE family protein phosphatase [Acidimicrobiales bacterium]